MNSHEIREVTKAAKCLRTVLNEHHTHDGLSGETLEEAQTTLALLDDRIAEMRRRRVDQLTLLDDCIKDSFGPAFEQLPLFTDHKPKTKGRKSGPAQQVPNSRAGQQDAPPAQPPTEDEAREAALRLHAESERKQGEFPAADPQDPPDPQGAIRIAGEHEPEQAIQPDQEQASQEPAIDGTARPNQDLEMDLAIVEFITSGPRTARSVTREVAGKLGQPPLRVAERLATLEGQGRLAIVDGKYRIVEQVEPQAQVA